MSDGTIAETEVRGVDAAATTSPPEKRAELYVRSLAPGAATDRQEAVIEQLNALEVADVIDRFTVHIWGRAISPLTAGARTDAGQFVLGRLEAFRRWAHRNGISLDGQFDTRTVRPRVTDREYTLTCLPVMLLAEFEDDSLRFVTPHTSDGQPYSIEDRIRELEGVPQPKLKEVSDEETGDAVS